MFLHIEACSQSLQTEALTRGLYTEQLLHTDALTQRCTEQLWHTDAFTQRSFYTQTLLHIEALTHRNFYAQSQKFLHTSFTQTSFYTEKPLHCYTGHLFYTEAFTHTKALHTHTHLYTQSFYTQTLLRIEACSQSRVYTEQLLHTEAFTQREAFAQSSLYNLIHAETLNTQMPKLLHRQVFTQRHLHKSSSHRCSRYFYTQKLLNTDAFTHRSIYPETLWHMHAYTHRSF